MLIGMRALTNDGDFLVGLFTEVELKAILWSLKNLEDYKNIFNDKNPYYYYNKIV